MKEKLNLVQEWDKTFPKSEFVIFLKKSNKNYKQILYMLRREIFF